jgi:hypothetical protein
LTNTSEANNLAELYHTHPIDMVDDLCQSMSRIADIHHTHTIDEFQMLGTITNNFSKTQHLHSIQTIQILQYQIDQTQQKIDSLKKEIGYSIELVKQLLEKSK